MICLFESRNQKETKTTYNVHEGQASINGGHAKEKGKKKQKKKKLFCYQTKRERPPSSRRKTHGATQLRNLNTKIQKIKDEKRKIKTHPTTWRRPRLSYLCSSLPDRATKHAIFESFELKRKVALKNPSVKKTTVKD
jgi:hypothetical protein